MSAGDDDVDKVFVAVRVRPLNDAERGAGRVVPWVVSENTIAHEDGTSATGAYVFDRVFDETSDNKSVYEATTSKIVSNVLSGFNGTVFAYGQTSSGKTHTMHGSKEELGVIPLAVRDVFDAVRRQGSDREFLIRVSYLEIYNEKMVDLFAAEAGDCDSEEYAAKLSIREDKDRGTYVLGLREEVATMPSQVLSLLERGTKRRHVGATNMNMHSSRSHTIFRMIIESRAIDGKASGADDAAVLVSTLNLVDLAGSERMSKTGAEGERAKEGAHINKSLMTLGVVINKLSEGVESKGGHIPYRDSKLTRILQPALGGNSKTAIVCAMTPAHSHCEETHSTLKFAQRAKRVINKATVNEVAANKATNAMLKRQQREIAALKARLEEEGAKVDDKAIEALRRRLAEADREKNLMALALEDGEEKAKEREAKIAELEACVQELTTRVEEVREEPHTEEVERGAISNATREHQQSLSAMTPDTLQAVRAFEEKVKALENDRDAMRTRLEKDLTESEKRREELERHRLDAVGQIASLREEIAEITATMVDGEGSGSSADVQILLTQAKRARGRAEEELANLKSEFFEEKSLRAVAEAEAKRLSEKIEGLMRQRESDIECGDSANGNVHLAHLALRKQIVKQNETIALLEERARESDQVLEEAIRVYEEEVAKNKKSSHGSSSDDGEEVSALVASNEELSKRCDALEKKYALAKAAFAKLSKEKAKAASGAYDGDARDKAAVESLKKENKEMKRQMHKLNEVYARLREKFTSGGEAAFDKVRDATEIKYDLQALERKRQVEKKALLAKISELENRVPSVGKISEDMGAKRLPRTQLGAIDANANA